jgi:2-polyprenyl-3-methyl-5-hydroxy-6-metoxy-1,4-benzoquinol methylase
MRGMWVALGKWVPWRIMRLLLRHWPPAYQLLHYGTWNVNTSQHWNDAWARHGKNGFRATGAAAELRQRILQVVPPNTTVLDVGCGVGEAMILLRDANRCICCGVDIAPAGISAVLKAGMDAKTASLPDIPYPDESFDVVVCTETLEHVTDAIGTIKSIRRVLKPGGLLLLSVPDGSVDEEDSHIHRFTAPKLREILTRSLVVESIETVVPETGHQFPSLFVVARRSPIDRTTP